MTKLTTKPFAKLFEIDGWQILFYVEPHGGEGKLHQVAYVEELGSADIILGFDTEDRAWEVFHEVDEQRARKVLDDIQRMAQSLADG